MSFTISQRPVTAGDRSGTAYVLGSDQARAEVWPSHGFNCLRWQIKQADGTWGDLLFTAPDWETNPVPTRSGHPILFPFPNRLAGGQLPHDGQTLQLPKNEATGLHAIHGFTPRLPWRVVSASTDDLSAAITGEFKLSHDALDAIWPADARLQLTYRLYADRLRVETAIDSADGKPLPFGLGYHPYFRIPGAPADIGECDLQLRVEQIWECEGNIPTGKRLPSPSELDFHAPRKIGATRFDTLYTSVTPLKSPSDPLCEYASLVHPQHGKLSLHGSEHWREWVLFIPTHRQAIAIEPYTCATDAAHLEAAGYDGGWQTLPVKGIHRNVVEYRWEPKNSLV